MRRLKEEVMPSPPPSPPDEMTDVMLFASPPQPIKMTDEMIEKAKAALEIAKMEAAKAKAEAENLMREADAESVRRKRAEEVAAAAAVRAEEAEAVRARAAVTAAAEVAKAEAAMRKAYPSAPKWRVAPAPAKVLPSARPPAAAPAAAPAPTPTPTTSPAVTESSTASQKEATVQAAQPAEQATPPKTPSTIVPLLEDPEPIAAAKPTKSRRSWCGRCGGGRTHGSQSTRGANDQIAHILISMFQVLTGIASTFNIPYPEFYTNILRYLAAFELDFFNAAPIGCIVNITFHEIFLVRTISPLVVIVLLKLVPVIGPKLKKKSAAPPIAKRRLMDSRRPPSS